MAVAMVAMLAFGGTYAYFTATTAGFASEDLKTGKIALVSNAGTITVTQGPLVDGDPITDKPVTLQNTSTVEAYIFIEIVVDIAGVTKPDGMSEEDFAAAKLAVLDYTFTDENNWTQLKNGAADVPGVYYMLADEAFDAKEIISAITFNADNNYHEGSYDSTNSETKIDVEDKSITVSFSANAIQTRNNGQAWASEYAAYEEAIA